MNNPFTKNKSDAFRPGNLLALLLTVLGIARWLIDFFTPLSDADQLNAGIYVGSKGWHE